MLYLLTRVALEEVEAFGVLPRYEIIPTDTWNNNCGNNYCTYILSTNPYRVLTYFQDIDNQCGTAQIRGLYPTQVYLWNSGQF